MTAKHPIDDVMADPLLAQECRLAALEAFVLNIVRAAWAASPNPVAVAKEMVELGRKAATPYLAMHDDPQASPMVKGAAAYTMARIIALMEALAAPDGARFSVEDLEKMRPATGAKN